MLKTFTNHLRGDGYQARALRSTGLVLLNFGGENFLRLASNLILSRLLFPEAFGLMALVQVVVAGTAMFSDFGFRGSVVQDPRGNDPEFLNTAWTLQIARGLLLMAIIMATAGPAARFYDEPLLGDLLWIAAFVPLIRSLESTRTLTADRTLQIERITILTLATNLIGSVITVLLAFWMQSVWALAIGLLISPGLQAVMSHFVLQGHPNKLQLDRSAALSLFKYGGFIFLASAAGFFSNHGDRAVLGKFVTLEDLAIYNIAMMLAVVPSRLSNAISNRVVFPLYARRPPAESERNRRKINQARLLITGPLILATGILAIIGDVLVRFMYDARYEAAGPFLILIALAAMPQIILQTYLRLPLASGHSGRFATLQIISALIRFGLLVLLVPRYGLVGAVSVLTLSVLLIYPVMLYMIRPYKAWDPVHDAFFFLCTIVLAAGIFWFNAETVMPIIEAAF